MEIHNVYQNWDNQGDHVRQVVMLSDARELEHENARLRIAIGKADAILNGWGLGKNSPLRMEIADILSNVPHHLPRKAGTPDADTKGAA
jgi:hypothetical protein